MLKNLLIVGAGGFFGSIARYLVYLLIDKRVASSFPWSTFTVNVAGSLILGIIMGVILKTTMANDNMRLLLAVGFCGSFTTFSTFVSENMHLYYQKNLTAAFLYTTASIIFGLAAVFGGYMLGKSV